MTTPMGPHLQTKRLIANPVVTGECDALVCKVANGASGLEMGEEGSQAGILLEAVGLPPHS